MDEFAQYPPKPGVPCVRLHGGPLDGMTVSVPPSLPERVRVNGPRHGDHTVWVTHTYVRRDGRYEYLDSEEHGVRTIACGPV